MMSLVKGVSGFAVGVVTLPIILVVFAVIVTVGWPFILFDECRVYRKWGPHMLQIMLADMFSRGR